MALGVWKLQVVMISILLWLLLSPYFVWGNRVTLILSIIAALFTVIILNYDRKKSSSSFLVAGAMALLMLAFYVLNGASLMFAIAISSVFCFFIVYLKQYIGPIFDMFKVLFSLSLVPGMIIWLLFLFGYDISYFEIGRLVGENELKADAGVSYIIYPGSCVLDYMLNFPVIRLQGMYDEPGVVGTIAGLMLVSDRLNLRNRWNLILFIAGLMSLSLAFYVIIFLYAILNPRSYKFLLLAVLIVFSVLLATLPPSVSSYIEARTIGRALQQENDYGIKRFNRDSENQVNWHNWLDSDLYEVLFGLSDEMLIVDGSSSWKTIVSRSGVAGIAAILCMYSLLFLLFRRKVDYHQVVFIIIFFLSSIQRPYIVLLPYVVIFAYALHVLSVPSIKNCNKIKKRFL